MSKIGEQVSSNGNVIARFSAGKSLVRSILVVDDEPMARNLLRLMLVRDGFDVIEAGNGDEAITMLETRQPDLMVLDVMMPGMDGITVCETVRAHETQNELPIIMLSARTDRESVNQGLAAGATSYLRKPISADALTNHVREILETTAVAT